MRVCKSWEFEARRALYHQIGYTWEERKIAIRQNQMLPPGIRDLLGMDTLIERKQLYAGAVKILVINDKELDYFKLDDYQNPWEQLNLKNVRRTNAIFPWPKSASLLFRASMAETLCSLSIDAKYTESWSPAIRLYPKLRHLVLRGDATKNLPGLIAALPLSNLDLNGLRDSGLNIFKAVASHLHLQSVDGLTIISSWIQTLSGEDAPWFASATYIGLIRSQSTEQFDKHLLRGYEKRDKDYTIAVPMLVAITPRVVALKTDTATIGMVNALKTSNVQQLTFTSNFLWDEGFSFVALLNSLSNLAKLRVLRFPGLRRSKLNPLNRRHVPAVSWGVIQDFTISTPQLEELSMAEVDLPGFSEACVTAEDVDNLLTNQMIWRRGLGWEIEDYKWASKGFRRCTARYAGHNYFGPWYKGYEADDTDGDETYTSWECYSHDHGARKQKLDGIAT